MKHTIRHTIALWFLIGLTAFPIHAIAAGSKEALVKAAFIYNFVKFVDWPDDKAISKQSNIDICVVGNSDVADAKKVFDAASTANLSLTLLREGSWENAATHCHIVFISASEQGKLDTILSGLKKQPVLTVSDIEGFADHGGMIGFVVNSNKVKLEVNKRSATESGLRVNAQLLGIALKVIGR